MEKLANFQKTITIDKLKFLLIIDKTELINKNRSLSIFLTVLPSTSTTDENVKKVAEMKDHRITIREVADDIGISVASYHKIFSSVLGMKYVEAKFVQSVEF